MSRQVIPGSKYRHFKGNLYEVICLGKCSETERDIVVYRALYGEGGIWVRPLDMFLDTVERDGKGMLRFEEVKRG